MAGLDTLTAKTIEKLKRMHFYGMADALQAHIESAGQDRTQLTPYEFFGQMVDYEYDDRHNRQIARNLKNAKFKQTATLAEIDFSPERELDKDLLMQLIAGSFIKKVDHVFILGSTGAGKSYLAQAIGGELCRRNFKIKFDDTDRFFTFMKMAKVSGTYLKEIELLEKKDVIIFDNFLFSAMDRESAEIFYQVLDDRWAKKPIIITSQHAPDTWYERIVPSNNGKDNEADVKKREAILDRLVHSAIKVHIKGESMRRKTKRKIVVEEI